MSIVAPGLPAPSCPPHDPKPRRPGFKVPAHACDVHAHVVSGKFPYIEQRVYTPPDASPEEYRHMLDALGIERGVLVQPSIYGTDNRYMLEAMAKDPARLRGVAVVPFDIPDAELEKLHAAGIRGVRSNIVDLKGDQKGKLPIEPLRALANRIKRFGWHVEFLMHVDEFPDLDRQLKDFPVDVTFGHLGYVATDKALDTPGFAALKRLLRDGKAWVKLTAPYRISVHGKMPFPDTNAFAQALVDAAADRLLWGSDWPHVFIRPAMPNDGDLFDIFAKWVPDAAMRKRILVDNPAKVYGFPG